VVQVLPLEEDPPAAGVLGEPRHLGERARAPGVVDEPILELRDERGIGLGLLVLDGDLVHGGDQGLRDELAAERTEVPFGAGDLTLRVRDEEFAGHATCSYAGAHAPDVWL
jgi:hypothetical protein